MTKESRIWHSTLGFDAWTRVHAFVSGHPAAVVCTPLMTGNKLVTQKLLQRSAGFLHMHMCRNRYVPLHAINAEHEELFGNCLKTSVNYAESPHFKVVKYFSLPSGRGQQRDRQEMRGERQYGITCNKCPHPDLNVLTPFKKKNCIQTAYCKA